MARRTRHTTLELEGGKELERQLLALDDAMQGPILGRAALIGAEPIRVAAEYRAPRRTGFLAAHIGKELIETSLLHADVAVAPESDAYYGVFQEIGTRHHKAQPFLRPAMDENKDLAVETSGEVLRRELLKVAKRHA